MSLWPLLCLKLAYGYVAELLSNNPAVGKYVILNEVITHHYRPSEPAISAFDRGRPRLKSPASLQEVFLINA